jgi:hypothetical protein
MRRTGKHPLDKIRRFVINPSLFRGSPPPPAPFARFHRPSPSTRTREEVSHNDEPLYARKNLLIICKAIISPADLMARSYTRMDFHVIARFLGGANLSATGFAFLPKFTVATSAPSPYCCNHPPPILPLAGFELSIYSIPQAD